MDADAAKQTKSELTEQFLGPQGQTQEKKGCAKEYDEKSLISYIYPLLQSN